MCGVFAIFDSVPSFTKRLLRASRRAKRRLKTVLRKFLTFFIYIYKCNNNLQINNPLLIYEYLRELL